MTKKQATGTDAKELFIKYFGHIIETSASKGHDGESTKRDDFTDLCHVDGGDLRDIVMGFSIEFMNMFNLGIRQSGDNFRIDRIGRVGRPKGAKNKKKKPVHEAHAEVTHQPPVPQKPDTGGQPVVVAPVAIEEEDKDRFGQCPKCDNFCEQHYHAPGAYKCSMCSMINKEEEIK